jgi:tetratricopeptide (TPR) repeat protein
MATDGRQTLDNLLTTCQQRLDEYQFQELILEIGNLYKSRGSLSEAEKTFETLLHYGERTGKQKFMAEALLRRGEVYSLQGRWAEAQSDLAHSGRIFNKSKDTLGIGKVENMIGTNFAEQGQLAKAKTYFTKALKRFEQSGQRQMAAMTMMNLGIVYTIMGEYEDAMNIYRRSLPEFQAVGEMNRIAEVRHNMGMSLMHTGKHRDALHEFELSLSYSLRAKNPALIGLAQLGKANAHYALKDFSLALALTNIALEEFTRINDVLSIADAYKLKGMILREQKHYDLALSLFLTSIRLNEENNNMLNLGETYYQMGLMETARGKKLEAREAFHFALEYFKKVGTRVETVRTRKELRQIQEGNA